MSLPVNDQGHLLLAGQDACELAKRYGTPLFVYDVDQILQNVDGYRAAFDAHHVPRVIPARGSSNHSNYSSSHTAPSQPRRAPSTYQIAYASKALSTTAIYELMKTQRNVSVDVVSGGELFTALHAGVDPRKIHFHGNNKNGEELLYALRSGVGCFVVDSFHEIELLQRLTPQVLGAATDASEVSPRKVNVLLRVSPGVTAHTHEHNTTGQVDSKFGFDVASGQARLAFDMISRGGHPNGNGHTGEERKEADSTSSSTSEASTLPSSSSRKNYLRVIGLHCHIGSQIFSTEGHVLAARRLLELACEWGMMLTAQEQEERDRKMRHTNNVEANHSPSSPDGHQSNGSGNVRNDDEDGKRFVLNVGGGYGISYTSEDTPLPSAAFIDALLGTVEAFLTERATGSAMPPSSSTGASGTHGFGFPEIWIEPGRSLVGAAGSTLYTVGARKTIPELHKHYVAIDGGMSDNIRPILYQAKYQAYICNRMPEHLRFQKLSPEAQAAELAANTRRNSTEAHSRHHDAQTAGMETCTVVGKLCETGDQLIKDCALPCATQSGDIMAVLCTGAYGYAMASNYNRMRRPPIVFISASAGRERVVVKRETYDDLVRNDVSFFDEKERKG